MEQWPDKVSDSEDKQRRHPERAKDLYDQLGYDHRQSAIIAVPISIISPCFLPFEMCKRE